MPKLSSWLSTLTENPSEGPRLLHPQTLDSLNVSNFQKKNNQIHQDRKKVLKSIHCLFLIHPEVDKDFLGSRSFILLGA